MIYKEPTFIPGGAHADDRGILSFVNDFKMDQIKRLYTIEHPDLSVIRAWQGHKKERKWFLPVAGSFVFMVVKPDHWEHPAANLPVETFILNADKPGVLHVPAGYATGFKALTPGAKMVAFSDFTLEESCLDDFRFEKDLWYDWNKL